MRRSATTSPPATSGPGRSPQRSAAREAEGNGRQAVDGPGDVTGSEDVAWGRPRPPAEAGAPSGAPARRVRGISRSGLSLPRAALREGSSPARAETRNGAPVAEGD